MNSYQNEYERKTSQNNSNMSKHYPRYPLANDPQASMQNTNYKDWLNECEGNTQYSDSTHAAVIAGLSVAGTILTGFTPLAWPGILLISFATLAPILWPSTDAKRTWIQFMRHGASFQNIPPETLNDIIEDANAYLIGFTRGLDEYERLFNIWKNGRTSTNAGAVQRQFERVHGFFINDMSHLERPSYKIILLSTYTHAANLHLNLLNQGVNFYDMWSQDQGKLVTPTASSSYYQLRLEEYTKIYTNYCTETYKVGLNTLKNEKGMTWNIYNAYRREMTLTVLDPVALFQKYILILQHKMDIHFELTREIYTDAINLEGALVQKELDTLENLLTREPSLFTWLHRLDFWTTVKTGGVLSNFLSGIQNFYRYTNSNTSIPSSIYGNTNGKKEEPITLLGGYFIYKLLIAHYWSDILREPVIGIKSIDFFVTRSNPNTPLRYNSGGAFDFTTTILQFESCNKITHPTCTPVAPTPEIYSHILSYNTLYNTERGISQAATYAFGWTHNSVDFNNTISNEIITQIPAVKARDMDYSSIVRPGPGHTGGDLIDSPTKLEFQCNIRTPTRYKIRMRYVSYDPNNRTDVRLNIAGGGSYSLQALRIGSTVPSAKDIINPKYEHFQYVDFRDEQNSIATVNLSSTIVMTLQSYNALGTLLIDKIEFIPITQVFEQDLEIQKLEKIQDTVNAIFTDHTKNTLKIETTDYEIDQTAGLIETLSEEQYLQKKMILLDTIKQAKQFSQSRNLLLNGDFQSFEGWTVNNDLTIQTDNSTFKGKYLYMTGARTTEINNTIFPAYVYQKIDESKLKPYTRYEIRGYISNSKDLELFVTRYDEEIHKFLNLSSDVFHVNADTQTNSYESQSYSFRNENNNLTNQQSQYPTTSNQSDYSQSTMVSSNCQNENAFSFSIDTGNLDFNENLGIGILFKISNPDGYAAIGNLEVIEEGSLTGEALAHMKQKEKKWKQHMEKKRMETQQAYDPSKQAVDALFTNAQGEELHYHTTLDHIQNADQFVQSIPHVYHDWLPDVPGMNYDVYQGLNARIIQAYNLYDVRNVITNGDFTQELQGWHAAGNATVQQMDGSSVLILSNWSAGVSQNLHVQDHYGYVLRVIAKKEGPGKGYVTIMDCNENQETLTFTSCEEGYMTKTVEVFPESDRVRIEMGETEGTFYIQSIELLCMKGYTSNHNQNTGTMYEQSYNGNYNQNYTNNDDLHSGCTCNQGHNSGCTCNQGYNR
ncbi:hypothetical protein CT694_35710 (plasmid) [Bacillus wiedmannii bv. thuringiensis]|nr:hypothetical protein CT694_35710 [Bacillus wiedmannii bv. thuringiensis]